MRKKQKEVMNDNSKLYWVKLSRDNEYSLFGFVMWTPQKECAKKYTLEQAEKLIKEIPPHVGIGSLVEVE